MQGDVLIVFYQLGSYGFIYFECYLLDVVVFILICNSNQIQKCINEVLINMYDNMLCYIDCMLGRIIEMFESYLDQWDVVMIYVFDYGELFGECGMYLYGMLYVIVLLEQMCVFMLMWFLLVFVFYVNFNLVCFCYYVEGILYSYDNIYYVVLGLFDVRSSVYQCDFDLFVGCCFGV